MNAPVNNLSLNDLSFYMDERLSRVNVLQFTFICLHENFMEILSQTISRSYKFSSVQMIQECGDDFAKVTFVTRLNPFEFSKLLYIAVHASCRVYKCDFSQFNII